MFSHFFYVLYWAIISLLLFLTFTLFPNNVVLGNARWSASEAAAYSGFWIVFLVSTIQDFAQARGSKLNNVVVGIIFFVGANAASIWMVARFAHLLGLGISSYQWAIGMGTAAAILQRLITNNIVGAKK